AAIELSTKSNDVGGEVFQIATNMETTVLELAEKLMVVLKRKGVTPAPIHHGAARTGDVKRNFSDTRKARQRLGWTARVSLDDGLDRTVSWFLEQRRSGGTSA